MTTSQGPTSDGSSAHRRNSKTQLLADSRMVTSRSQESKDDQLNNRTTDAQTMMHILKANIGTGVLAMPNAFKNVGLWLGFILIPVIGAICIHCMNILIVSHNHLCDRFNYESLDYDQVASLGLACGPKFARRLAKKAHIVVTVFLILTQIGFCCVYIMFVVENIQLAVLNLFNVHYTTTTYLMIVFPFIGLTSCTSNLKYLARISILANLLQLTGLALIFYDLLQLNTYSGHRLASGQSDTEQPSNAFADQSPSNVSLADELPEIKVIVKQGFDVDMVNGLPLFFATAVYAFEGIGVVLPLIKEMEHPSRISGLSGVLNTAMSMVAVLYMGMGFFGYSKYGQFVQGSITLNLPETTLNELCRLCFAIAIGLSYSLQFYVPWTIMWPFIDESLFYSYRPRESRDKLDILNKLSAENEWAIDASGGSSMMARRPPEPALNTSVTVLTNGNMTSLEFDYDSTASTFATSYAASTYHQQSRGQLRPQLSVSIQQQHQGGQYGALTGDQAAASRYLTVPGLPTGLRGRRNRLDDVMEQEDTMPEVQWRPPPRSMRGKRKLVRYTVIMVSVLFTFVAAALIPRLDLFISLIGALASSCLAIIFPALIQMCTFWSSFNENENGNGNDDDDDDDADQRHDQYKHHAGSHKGGHTKGRLPSDGDIDSGAGKPTRPSIWTRKRHLRRQLLWLLFVCKNILLILFGILGLITGSWISITQLSSAYMGIETSS